MKKPRIVVTGLGAVTPIGNSAEATWKNALEGKNGVGPITKFDATYHRTKFACEVKNFDQSEYLDKAEIKRSDINTKYAIHSAAQAVEDSGLNLEKIDPHEIGVIWGTGIGGMNSYEDEAVPYWRNGGTPRFSPFFIPKMIPNMAPGMISMKFGLMGVNYGVVSACASSNHAIINAYDNLVLGRAKVIVCGGSEAAITAPFMAGFSTMRALSPDNEAYTHASRPFDLTRNGFVMGEGGGALVLEELEHALERGASIYAELSGVGATADAYHLSSSHPDGHGALAAMNRAIAEANVSLSEIEYINCHATSTPVGDISEIKAITRLFDQNSKQLVLGATKSMTGHLIGAAGAVESLLTVKAIQDGVIPPTINTVNLDPTIPADLQIAGPKSEKRDIKIALSNTFGFGGHNTSVLYRKFED